MDLGLKGKVALVTGTGSQTGFGKAICLTLAKEGCDIVSVSRGLEGAEQTASEVRALGCKATAIKTDVTKVVEVDDMVKAALKEFGKIDILVNNAGGGTPPGRFAETTEDKWDKDINLNLKSVLYCTRAVLPHMISRKTGKIVSISSSGGFSGAPFGIIYGATKAAIISFTLGLSQEVVESGINVNCIAPGSSNTAFYDNFPLEFRERVKKMEVAGKTTKPKDVADAVAFLVSDVSIRMVGQCLKVYY
jgi:NAD(P)-dependent dehydrogenase (short-subunit alcohol dehydrogenase family)